MDLGEGGGAKFKYGHAYTKSPKDSHVMVTRKKFERFCGLVLKFAP